MRDGVIIYVVTGSGEGGVSDGLGKDEETVNDE